MASQNKVKGKAYFDGNEDYLSLIASTDWNFGTADFKIEMKIKPSSFSTTQYLINTRGSSDLNNWWMLDILTSGKLFMETKTSGVTTTTLTSVLSLSLNTEYDIEISKVSGTMYLFINGVLDKSVASGNTQSGGNTLSIGITVQDNSGDFTGYMKGVKVAKGVGGNTTGFTPPEYFINNANTVLCMNFAEPIGSTTFIDETGKTVTTNGNVIIVA